jgi:hypothetical protein
MTRNLLLVALMTVIALPAAAQTAAEQLQKAIFAQDSLGNVDSAITTYRQLAYSGLTPRDVAAEAQYRLAQSLLVKGDVPAATREFERMERDFADYQKLMANLATARRTPPAAPGATFLDDVQWLLLEAQASQFDGGVPVSLQGKIIQILWTNPRSVMVVDAGNQRYAVQLTSPNAMIQQGISRGTFTLAQEIVVQALQPNRGRLASKDMEVVQANQILSREGKVLFDWSKVPEAVRAPLDSKK